MEILRVEDGGIAATEQWLASRVERHKARSLFLPAGETPKPLYAKWRKEWPAYLSGLKLMQVDDVLTGTGAGVFARFFQDELPGHPVIRPVQESKADLAILGLGTNGHVAFHEPGLPMSFRFGEVLLESDTARRLSLEAGTKGITYGVGVFSEAKAILLVVRGESKKSAFEKFLKNDPSVPASGLLTHPDLTVLKDF